VKIGIEKDKERFFAEARVLYSTVGMGMGLIFTVVDPAEVSILEKWIADLAETDRIPKQQLRKRLKITPRRVPSMSFAAY
jgi:hypothetical protein